MDISTLLDTPARETVIKQLAAQVRDEESMAILMDSFFDNDWLHTHRAHKALVLILKRNPEYFEPYHSRSLQALEEHKHDALLRNILSLYQHIDIPEDVEGELYELCFKYIIDPSYAIAIRAFAMTVSRRIAVQYPDLIPELIGVIQGVIPHGSKGVQSRGKNELVKLVKALKDK